MRTGTLAYMTDWANNDARTEGMSYGMMIAVELNKKREFDALWNWAKTYMLVTDPRIHPWDTLHGQWAPMEHRDRPVRRRTAKNISPWRFTLRRTLGQRQRHL